VSAPQTEAGKALLAHASPWRNPADLMARDIAAIEREATHAALAAVRERVEALTTFEDAMAVTEPATAVYLDEVLVLLEELDLKEQ
jgi:hypothetical protein